MSSPKVSICPVMEAVAASMFGIEQVPVKYQKRMVTRAAKEAHKIYSELEETLDRVNRNYDVECSSRQAYIDRCKDLEKEVAELREFKGKVNKELRLWHLEACDRDSSEKALNNIEDMILEGGKQ